jgi:hypothetical protein
VVADEYNTNKETIRQILHEDLRKRRICRKFVPHRLTDEQKKRRLTSCQNFMQICQDSPRFICCIFLFPKVKTALKGKRFQDVEGIKIYLRVKLNAVSLEAFAVSKNVLNDSKNLFKLAKITLNTNKTIFDFLIFIIYSFLTSSGTLFPDLVYISLYICKNKMRNREQWRLL